jgi:outer membrane receptor protein involved in Fe transport
MKKTTLLLLLLFSLNLFSQQTKISGKVLDAEGNGVPGANIVISNTQTGTVTDFDGNFSIMTESLPVIIKISYVGYEPVSIKVESDQPIKVVLKENSFLDDVVVTASRTQEKVKESPVSIERMGLKEIQRTTAPSFYDGLSNLKGIDLNTNSLTFQSVNSRGFATFANNRFLQLIDGMDNSSPALNFPLGNLVGINELDVQSVEILPGASSALYGANAFNGVLSMTSKSPFQHKGLSAYVKYGVTQQEAAGTNPYTDAGIRYAWGGDIAAAKVNFSFLKGTDWYAVDYSDTDTSTLNASKRGTRESNPSYDGMNVYGDEVATTLPLSAQTGGLVDDIYVSRTGYREVDLTNYEAKSIKGDIGFYYRPSGQPGKLEFIWNSRFGTGTTIYQGANRYVLDGIFIHQHKLEVRNKNFFLRAYYTGEDAGNSYDTRFTAINVNRKWKSDEDWFTQYATVYSAARLGLLPGTGGTQFPEDIAHQLAREYADTGRYEPGTPDYQQAFEEVKNLPDFRVGGRFIDETTLKHVEGNYNFRDLIDFAEIQVGGSLRKYSLHSEGTIFTDYPGLDPISITESGAYTQITKKLMENKLKLSASIRYDKQLNFEGHFSPRLAVVYSAGENKEHNFRASFQTGFRNPSTQDLYIGMDLGRITLLGAAPDNWDRYNETVKAFDPVNMVYFDANIVGSDAYTNSYTLSSFLKFAETHDPNDLEISNVETIKPEQVTTIEFGYRGEIIKNLGVDFTAYQNTYNDFGASTRVMALSSQVGNVHDATAFNAIGTGAFKAFQLYTNADVQIKSYGMDIGVDYKINNYRIGLIYDYAKLDFDEEANPDFRPGFNTPEHRVKLSLGNDKIFGDLGFRIDYKYQSAYEWQSSFADGTVPERSVLDAQLTYHLKKYKTKFKVGGTNLTGQEYLPAPGTGKIGSMIYFGVMYNN